MGGAKVAPRAVPLDAVDDAMARGPEASLTGWLAPVPHGVGDRVDAAAPEDARMIELREEPGENLAGRGGAIARSRVEKMPRASASGPEPARRLISPPEEGAGPRTAATARARLFEACVTIVFSFGKRIAHCPTCIHVSIARLSPRSSLASHARAATVGVHTPPTRGTLLSSSQSTREWRWRESSLIRSRGGSVLDAVAKVVLDASEQMDEPLTLPYLIGQHQLLRRAVPQIRVLRLAQLHRRRD